MTEEKLQLRIYGDKSLPTLIYLPGLHGDWTLVGSFRKHVLGKVRFVEITYPRTLVWSLDDYAAAIEAALSENEITHGWLLGESFGSQPLWAMVGRKKFQADGIILAGGFAKHPTRWAVRPVETLIGCIPTRVFVWIVFNYAKIARFRYRREPETLNHIAEFIERRADDLDRRTVQHRLHLIAASDFRPIASQTKIPVFAITGILDPIVPWLFVRRWLRKNCTALRDYKIVRADHNVLATGTREAAKQILDWMLRR